MLDMAFRLVERGSRKSKPFSTGLMFRLQTAQGPGSARYYVYLHRSESAISDPVETVKSCGSLAPPNESAFHLSLFAHSTRLMLSRDRPFIGFPKLTSLSAPHPLRRSLR